MQSKETAFITGATSGIGAEFAKTLAKQNYDLVITGRRADKIKLFAEELMKKYNVTVEVVIAELAHDDDIAKLVEKIRATSNLTVLLITPALHKEIILLRKMSRFMKICSRSIRLLL